MKQTLYLKHIENTVKEPFKDELLNLCYKLVMEEFSYFQSYCLHEQPSFVQSYPSSPSITLELQTLQAL
jgi:hypothetical protein